MGCRWPRHQRTRYYRPKPAMGQLAKLHIVRQMHAGLPDGRNRAPGCQRRRNGARPRAAGETDRRSAECEQFHIVNCGSQMVFAASRDACTRCNKAIVMDKLRLATVWLGGCSGCHMSFLDLDEWLFELAGRVDVVY